MKLATFLTDAGEQRIAAIDVDGGRALDLAAAARSAGADAPEFADMLSLIEAGDAGLAKARDLVAKWPAGATLPLSGLHLISPLPRPTTIRDCLAFEQHLVNGFKQLYGLMGKEPPPLPPEWYKRPSYGTRSRMNVVGHEHDIQWPVYSEQMDYELELACVIGKKGKNLAAASALDHVFGFTIFNDFSARDEQARDKQSSLTTTTRPKDFDTGNVIGPWIVTTDEIGDPQTLDMDVRVNGERRGGGNSKTMYYSFADLIAFISIAETVYPGDVIASGTVETGCGLEVEQLLKPNDVVELEIGRIGVLRNRIVRA